jgi:histidinol-phosphate/aromatic aminotransferase/cobyric acid decarboxylase-like protein
MLDLQRQYEQVRAEVLGAVGRVCASQQYILGPEVEAFEREIADFCGSREAVGCASGTDALWLALVAAGVQPGDQVLTTPCQFLCIRQRHRAAAFEIHSSGGVPRGTCNRLNRSPRRFVCVPIRRTLALGVR